MSGHRTAAQRRRLAALCAVAGIALIAGVAVGAGGGSKTSTKERLKATKPPELAVKRAGALPLRKQTGEVLMTAFRGPGVPSYVRQALRQGRAAGVVLFRANATTPAAMREVTSQLQRSSH